MASEAETAAVARALTKRYANGVVALDQLDLEIERASITALIGNNGSGKTTFLKILAGLLTPDSGYAQALGCDPATRATWLRARLGYVSQAVELDPEMTAWETLSLFATLYGLPRATCHAPVAALAESLASRSIFRAWSRPSPAGCANDFTSPSVSCTSRNCCCLTSRPRLSTRLAARLSGTSSHGSATKAARS